MPEEIYGIKNLEEVSEEFDNLCKGIYEGLEDYRFDVIEIIKTGRDITSFYNEAKDIEEMKKEAGDISPEEAKVLLVRMVINYINGTKAARVLYAYILHKFFGQDVSPVPPGEPIKIGIEDLVKLQESFMSLCNQITESLADNNYDFMEVIGTAKEVQKFVGIAMDFGPLLAQAKDIDPEEAQRLIADSEHGLVENYVAGKEAFTSLYFYVKRLIFG